MKLFRGLVVLSLIGAASGCDFIKSKLQGAADDAGDLDAAITAETEAGAEATPAQAELASNEDDIARFPDETKLENVAATTKRPYKVRDAPPAGAIVVTLTNGQTVTQIASRGKYFLVTFDDPKTSKKLMGWVHEDAFVAAAPNAVVAEPKCSAGEVALIGDTAFCGRICEKDSDCGGKNPPETCHGSAAKWKAGKAGDSVQVCAATHPHDAGAPNPIANKDGGGLNLVTTLDAGGKPAADAGKPADKPIPTPTTDIVPAVDGKCAPNYVIVKKDGKCHKLCPKPSDCRAAFFCGRCDGNNTCNDTRNFCPN